MTIITDLACTGYRTAGHPEKPQRISRTVDLLKSQQVLDLKWADPIEVTDPQLLRAHSPAHLARLNRPEPFDGDTPWHPDIDRHARRSTGGALKALALARAGEPAFSLMRPPGHHCTRDQAMGFCYMASMAVAMLEALATGAGRVAVLDFDVHHGNGTEDILTDKPGVVICSIHQHPCYPGTGLNNVGENCFNFPVPPLTSRETYRTVLSHAIERIADSRPEVIGVSAGFDAYSQDPLAQETLEREDFQWIGAELRKLGIPVFSVLEGGYSVDLPELILAYLSGLEGRGP
jgi:acetoin utilization deacetylase AcuC-like enzyme